MKRSIIVTLAALVSFASLASAQPQHEAQAKPPKVKVLDMGAVDVKGDVPTGELIPIGVRELGKSTSLLRIRRDFIDMILKAAEDMS